MGTTELIVLAIVAIVVASFLFLRREKERDTSRQLRIVADFFGFSFEPGEREVEDLRDFEIAENAYQPRVLDRMRGNIDGFDIEVFDFPQSLLEQGDHELDKITTLRFPTIECDEWIAKEAKRNGFIVDLLPNGKFLLVSKKGFVIPDERTEFIRRGLNVVLSRKPDA